MNFFNPTQKLKELLLLQHIEQKPNTTQKEIAQVIDRAPSMVNVYIDELEEDGYLKRDYQSPKMIYYNITQEGIKRKNFLSITYLNELLGLYLLAEHNVEDFLIKLEEKGYRKILLYGGGEVAETILSIVRGRISGNLKVLAVIDDNIDIQGGDLIGFKIIPKEEIYKYKHDGIVITSYTFENEINERLKEINYPQDKIEKFFNHE